MSMMKRLSVTLPPELLKAAENLARKEGRTKSELFREALRRYAQHEMWRELQPYGWERVQELDTSAADVETAIAAYRLQNG